MDKQPIAVGLKRDGTKQARSNQWIKRKAIKAVGADAAIERDKSRLRAEYASRMLESHLDGTVKLDAVGVQAAKALMDKGLPSLQAIETTSVEPAMTMTEETILASLVSAMTAYPHLVNRAQAELAKQSSSPVSDTQQPKADVA